MPKNWIRICCRGDPSLEPTFTGATLPVAPWPQGGFRWKTTFAFAKDLHQFTSLATSLYTNSCMLHRMAEPFSCTTLVLCYPSPTRLWSTFQSNMKQVLDVNFDDSVWCAKIRISRKQKERLCRQVLTYMHIEWVKGVTWKSGCKWVRSCRTSMLLRSRTWVMIIVILG